MFCYSISDVMCQVAVTEGMQEAVTVPTAGFLFPVTVLALSAKPDQAIEDLSLVQAATLQVIIGTTAWWKLRFHAGLVCVYLQSP